MSTETGHAIIIGGSMAGLFAAIGLRSHGWKVDVYERSAGDLINRGAGIATHHELYDALRKAGVALRDEMGVHSKGRIMFDVSGEVIGRLDMPQLMSSWGLIYRFLRQQLPDTDYHDGCSLKAIESGSDSVSAIFENGERATGDWLIAGDGARSSVRAIVAPAVESKYTGYVGWRGLIDESLIPAAVLTEFDCRMALGMAPGGHWLGYLVAGPDDALEPGQRWFNWGWYRTADDDTLRELLTDDEGTHYPHGIPHDRLRETLVERMRDEAHSYLAPQIRTVVDATRRPFIQGMYDHGCTRFVYDRVVLIGDAACTARPHVGLGVSKAADDASTLAASLSGETGAATLAEWESRRVAYSQAILEWGRRLGSYIGPAPETDAHRKLAAYHQRPDVLMAQTAAIEPAQYIEL